VRRRGAWRRYLLVPLAGLGGLNALVWLGYTLPRSVEQERISDRVAELGQLVREQRVRTEALAVLSESIRSNERDSERFFREVVCPNEAAFLDLIEDLERAVVKSGLRPDRRTIRRDEMEELGLARYSVGLPASGSYRQLVDLIEQIESGPAFVIIEEIRLASQDAGSASLQVELATFCLLDAGGDAV
jgi:Tfp pilus assembly protein PilO